MTGDQKLILKIEHVASKIEADQFLAAMHLLDEILKDLESPIRQEFRPLPTHERAPAAAGIRAVG